VWFRPQLIRKGRTGSIRRGIGAAFTVSISGNLKVVGPADFSLWRDGLWQFQRFTVGSAGWTTVQRSVGAVGYRYQAICAEAVPAAIAMELIAAGTEHGAAFCAGMNFQEDVASVLVVFDWEAFKEGVAGGTGS